MTDPAKEKLPAPPLFFGIIVCLLLLGIRLITLPYPELVDSTEGRYAAAAVTMMERGDYLTPWIDMGSGPEPYLGKPPIHFWLTIVSYKIFGISAFSSRVPSFLSTLICAALVFVFGLRVWGIPAAVLSTLFYLSCGLTFFLGGAAVLDTTLMLFVTLAMFLFAGFFLWNLNARPRLTALLIGAALSGAFLTKGPVGLVIFLFPTLAWYFLLRDKLGSIKFPLLYAIYPFLILTVPWYLACERAHPGFLWYFIVKENLLRIVSNEYGSRYGTGHPQFFGTSFFYTFSCFAPWSVILIFVGWKKFRSSTVSFWKVFSPSVLRECNPALLFVGAWSLSMPLFLCFTTQYTANYLAPIMPGLALLLGGLLGRSSNPLPRWYLALGPFNLILIVCAFMIVMPIVGVALGAPWWILPLAWSMPPGIFATRRYFSIECPVRLYSVIAILLAFLYLNTLMSFSKSISSRRSTHEVLALVRAQPNLPSDRRLTVGFVGQLPFSSAVYGLIETPHIVSTETSPEESCNSHKDFYIVSKKSFDTIKCVNSNLSEVGRTSKWIVLRPLIWRK